MLYAIVGMLVVILDQLVKFWVDKNMVTAGAVHDFIPGIISLVRVQNDGAAFSFLSGGGARIGFIVLTGFFTVLVILALATKFVSGRFGRWCLVLVTAGGLSNCLDRVLYGYVLDMFRVDLFDFAVFNVADIFITVFCIAFILYILFGGEKEREPDADEFDDEDIEEAQGVKLPEPPIKKNRKKVLRKEDFDEDEEDEEEAQPSRPSPKARPVPKLNKRPKPANVYDDDEDDLPAPPRKAEKARFGKRMESGRNTSLFDEEPSAAPVRGEAPAAKPAAPAASAPAASEDPFAEWEKANARLGKPVSRTETAVQAAANDIAAMFEEKPASSPVPEVKKPAESAKPAPSGDFDLDSILSEFK